MLPYQALRDTGSTTSLGLPDPGERREKNESSLHQVDSSRERNTTRPRAQQVDLTASVQPPAKPFTPSALPMKQPIASTSPLPPPPAPALAKMASSRPSRTGEARPADNQSTAVPAAVSRDRQATAQRGDISKSDVEVNVQSRAGQVSPCCSSTSACDPHQLPAATASRWCRPRTKRYFAPHVFS